MTIRRTALLSGTVAGALTAMAVLASPASSASAPTSPTASDLRSAATARAAAMPTSFAFGLQAGTDAKGLGGWLARSGVPWDYSYRYLGGGAGTAADWASWAPSATYPISYAQNAASKGYRPVFTYYNMLATQADCAACGEAQQDLTDLNSGSGMRAYFEDFALLMQRLGNQSFDGVVGYAGDVTVQVEPDLFGYAEQAAAARTSCFGFCTASTGSPRDVRSAVASSGFALAKGYPDTFQGFNETLLRIRDTYAPNVRLAAHLSNWATGFDLNSATSAALDATALGKQASAFLGAAGVTYTDGTHSTYDLLFNDVSNKDAGYYTYVLNKPRYWDQDNSVFPNFHRWEDYVRAVTTQTGKKAVVWQVPIGNQLYAAENNTTGHWQDNRVEYFFDHVGELASAGIVGALFGTAFSYSSNYADWAGDGVTNPAPVCSSDGWSSGKVVCSSIQTPVSDDDGGYLRVRGRGYYAAPFRLS